MSDEPEAIAETEHEHLLYAEPVEIELGFALIPLANAQNPEALQGQLPGIRIALAQELGLDIPLVRIRDNLQLDDNAYHILIRGNVVARGELHPACVLALVTMEGLEQIRGIATKDPAFGIDAFWIPKEQEKNAANLGYSVVKPIAVMSTHIQETFRKYAEFIFDYNALASYLQQAETHSPLLAAACEPKTEIVFSVLKRLLRQHISIRDQQTILETIASSNEQDPKRMTDIVRKNLYSLLFSSVSAHNGIHALVLGDDLVDVLHKQQAEGSQLSRELARQIGSAIRTLFHGCEHDELIVLCPPSLRSFLATFPTRIQPHIPLVFEDEVPLSAVIVPQGIVSIAEQP